jgi:hypothetical protein
VAAEILRFDKDKTAVPDQYLGTDRRMKIVERRLSGSPRLIGFLALRQFLGIEGKGLGKAVRRALRACRHFPHRPGF